MQTLRHWIINHPRRLTFYVLFGILGILLVLLAINDKNWKPLKGKSSWEVTSNYSRAGAKFTIDKDLKTYWTSYVAVTSGIYFQINTRTPKAINGILLDLGEKEHGHPVHWVLKVSSDGKQWHTVTPRKQFTYRSMYAIVFPAVRAQYFQIIHTSSTSNRARWIISELNLLQPIVPWQFERSTLISCILACVFTIIAVLISLSFRLSPQNAVILAIILIVVVLSGWFLRVYDVRSYELSDKEIQIHSLIHVEEQKHGKWLTSYFQDSKPGTSWLSLLFIRWAYQFCASDYTVAVRLVPAIFGIFTVLLLFVLWKTLLSDTDIKGIPWEGVLVAALVSVTGFPVMLSRQGSFSVSLVFFIILHCVISYRLLYQYGSYGWIPCVILSLFFGEAVAPAMKLAPIGIILFGGLYVGFSLFRSRANRLERINQIRRYIFYIISVIPLYVFWYFMETDVTKVSRITSFSSLYEELTAAFHLCGLTGIAGLFVVTAISLIGLRSVLKDKAYQEWFLYSQLLFFSIIAPWFSSSDSTLSILILTILVFCVFAKGTMTILSVLFKRLQHEIRPFIQSIVMISLIGYLTVLSTNTFFAGNTTVPSASEFYEKYSQGKMLNTLIQHIIEDPDDCKSIIVAGEQQLTELYSTHYDLEVSFDELEELQRLSELGRFWTYVFMPLSSKIDNKEIAERFFNQYYTEIGRSTKVVLYKLRDQFYVQKQRYLPQDLYRNVGHHVEDDRSSSQFVRIARKGETPGFLTFGPSFPICHPGRYTVRFALRSSGNTEDVVAILEVVADTYNSLARLELKGTDFPESTEYYLFDLPIELDMTENPAFQMKRLQFFINFTGKADLRLDYIELIPEESLAEEAKLFRKAWLPLLVY